jgi:hypothetical protein
VGDERAVGRREPEAREVVRLIARRVEVEDDAHLLAQALERELSHALDHAVDLTVAGGGGLHAITTRIRRKSGWRSSVAVAASSSGPQVLARRAQAPLRELQLLRNSVARRAP